METSIDVCWFCRKGPQELCPTCGQCMYDCSCVCPDCGEYTHFQGEICTEQPADETEAQEVTA